MNPTVMVYGVLMMVAGALLARITPLYPALFEQVPPMMAVLLVGLVIDIAIMALAGIGKAQPLDMPARIAGFIAGFIVYIVMSMAMGRA